MEVEHLTTEEVQAEIDAILAKYPVLDRIDPSDYCCSCCAYSELASDYGGDVAAAWDELEGYRFLLK